MQTDDGPATRTPVRPDAAPPVAAPGPVTVVAVLDRPSTPEDHAVAEIVGVDAVSYGGDLFAVDADADAGAAVSVGPCVESLVRVTAPVDAAAIGAVGVALYRGVRVVAAECRSVADCAGLVRAVRTYDALSAATSGAVSPGDDGTVSP
jgi:hypothetical protein